MADLKNRRDFLKLTGFLTVSCVGAILAGCGEGGSSLPAALPGRTPSPSGTFSFPAGIASGDPRESSIVLWTKLGVNDAAMGEDIPIIVQVASVPFDSKNFSQENILVSVPLQAYSRYAHTVHHRVEGLAAGTYYWYRFVADNDISVQGRTKTAPSKASETPVNFAYVSCQDWAANHWAAYQLLAEERYENLDFIVHLGDYIYETADDGAFQNGGVEPSHAKNPLYAEKLSGVTGGGVRYANSLDDYRYLYSVYRSDPRIQAIHAKFPMIAIWDDHEFTNDAWGDHETYSDNNFSQFDRRRAANQAWFEYMPVTLEDVSFSPERTGTYENIRIYREFAFGKVMQLVMTDERLYRADHAVPEGAGEEVVLEYFSRILGELGDLGSTRGLYHFLNGTKVMAFTLERLLNDAINKGQILFVTVEGLKKIKPMLVSMLNELAGLNLSVNDELKVDKILTIVGTLNGSKIWEQLTGRFGMRGFGSRYAAFGEVLKRFVARNAESHYAMLGRQQTDWWASSMSAAHARGAVWKIWGNEVCFVKMDLDVNRLSNKEFTFNVGADLANFQLAINAAAKILPAFVGVLKYLLTSPEIRSSLSSGDYIGDGTPDTPPGQDVAVFADSWDGYPDSRDYLTNYLHKNNINNVIAITGDLHTFIAGQVVDRDSDNPVMLDFAGAGVSSNSFGGVIGSSFDLSSLSNNSMTAGILPLLKGRGNASGVLFEIIDQLLRRPDKPGDGRDIFSRLLTHFSDEVQWAEGVANGFVTVTADTSKATFTYHNLRVERDEAGNVLDPATYITTDDMNSAYERRTSFTVYASGGAADIPGASVAVWPKFPSRLIEYEIPAAIPENQEAARSAMRAAPPPSEELEKLRDGVAEYIRNNPDNPYANIFMQGIRL